jgi:DNA-binding winged helix-turn-helix (wHTH) protein
MLHRFADLELDDERAVLRRDGREIDLEPKPMAVLVELLRQHPRVVPAEELLERVWPEAVVTKSSVARAVRSLRRALDARPGAPSIVRTVRGRGYGLAVEVERTRGAADPLAGEGAFEDPPLVGRAEPLERLGRALRAAASGRGAAITVVGEPGIGKTTLAHALVERARRAGAAVGVARCSDEADAPVLWPWVEVLGGLRDTFPTEAIRDAAGGGADLLRRVAPGLLDDGPAQPAPDPVDQGLVQHRVFDAIEGLIAGLARARPLLLVLDDLQWTDPSTAELFCRLARDVGSRAILLVGLHRDPEPAGDAGDDAGGLEALQARLGELPDVRPPIRLGGLDAEALAEIAEAEGRIVLDPDERAELHRRTGGNPFFAIELARAGALGRPATEPSVSGPEPVPARIRTVVRSRVARLSAEARRLLRAVAIVGGPFDLPLIAGLVERSERETLEVLEEIERAALVREVAEQPGTFAFVHALVPEAITATLSRAERVALHAHVAETLVRLFGDRADPPAARIAHHFGLAVIGGEHVDAAIEWARRAGDRAREQLLYWEAAGHYERALGWLRARPDGRETMLAETLLAAGRAHLGQGEPRQAGERFWEALDLTARIGTPALLAEAAWPLAATQYRGRGARRLQETLQSAIDRWTGDPACSTATLARLHAALARSLSYTSAFERVDLVSRRAVTLAREAADLECELKALATRDMVLVAEPRFEERAAVSRDRIAIAVETGDRNEEFLGRIYRIMRLVQEVAPEEIDREIDRCAALAETSVQSDRARACLLDVRALRCCWLGDVALGDALIAELGAAWEHVDPAYGLMSVGAKRILIDRIAGRPAPVDESDVRNAIGAGEFALPKPYTCAIAVRLHEQGRVDDAREIFAYLSRLEFADLQRDATYLVTVAQLSELAHRLADADRARLLAPRLEPFAGRYAAGHTAAVRGAVDRYRGLLAWTLGDLDGADTLLAAAVDVEVRMDAAPWEAMTRADRARLALDRGGDGGRALAARELDAADTALARRPAPGMRAFVADQRARL